MFFIVSAGPSGTWPFGLWSVIPLLNALLNYSPHRERMEKEFSLFENKKLKNAKRERETIVQWFYYSIYACIPFLHLVHKIENLWWLCFKASEQIAYICLRSRLPVSASANPIFFEIHPAQIFRKNIINPPKNRGKIIETIQFNNVVKRKNSSSKHQPILHVDPHYLNKPSQVLEIYYRLSRNEPCVHSNFFNIHEFTFDRMRV